MDIRKPSLPNSDLLSQNAASAPNSAAARAGSSAAAAKSVADSAKSAQPKSAPTPAKPAKKFEDALADSAPSKKESAPQAPAPKSAKADQSKPQAAPANHAPKAKPTKSEDGNQAGAAPKSANESQDSQPTGERASAKGAKKAASQSLTAIGQAVGKGTSAIKGAPVLAVLTGNVDQVDPLEIPSIITKSNFVANALAEPDVNLFIQAPQSAGALLSDLKFDTSLIAKAEQLGLNKGEMISPKDLFSALGIDPSRIASELSILKDNIQLDGLNPYMTRSAAMQGRRGMGGMTSPDLTLDSLASKPDEDDWTKNQAAFGPGAQSIAAPFPGSQLVPADAASQSASARPSASSTSTSSTMVSGGLSSAQLPSQSLSSATTGISLSDLRMSEMLASCPGIGRATADPFEVVGQRIDLGKLALAAKSSPSDRLMHELEQLSNRPSGDLSMPHLGTLNATASRFADQAAALPQLMNLDQAGFAKDPSLFADARLSSRDMDPRSVIKESLEQYFNINDASARTDGGARDLMQALKPTAGLNSGEGLSAITASPAFGGQEDSRSASDGSQHNSGEQGRDSSFAPILHGLGSLQQGAAGNLRTETSFGQVLSQNEVKGPINQEIYDRASMLVKDGGGSIRLDLGTPELGNLDLAIRVDHDRVEVRILAASERARDMLNQELPKLRESLALNNLQLKHVDVGVGGGSAWSQSFGQSNFQQQRQDQHFANEVAKSSVSGMNSISGIRGVDARAISSMRPSMIPTFAAQSFSRDGGSFAIRA